MGGDYVRRAARGRHIAGIFLSALYPAFFGMRLLAKWGRVAKERLILVLYDRIRKE